MATTPAAPKQPPSAASTCGQRKSGQPNTAEWAGICPLCWELPASWCCVYPWGCTLCVWPGRPRCCCFPCWSLISAPTPACRTSTGYGHKKVNTCVHRLMQQDANLCTACAQSGKPCCGAASVHSHLRASQSGECSYRRQCSQPHTQKIMEQQQLDLWLTGHIQIWSRSSEFNHVLAGV